MDALYRNNTWELSDLPAGRKVIGSKWVYKTKYKSDCETKRFKARLLAKYYNQKDRNDFDETFSPVVNIVTARKYYLDLIAEFGLLVGKPSHIPLQPNAALSREPTDTDSKLKNIANQLMNSPPKYHLDTALKVIRYLNGSPCKGLNIMKSYASGIELKAYSDADSARCVDKRGFVIGKISSWEEFNGVF
ncbi:ribonuclease H-like domain-containing protein [Tanacetum coccineum]